MRSIIIISTIYFAFAETNRYSGKHNELPHSGWTPPNLNTSWRLQHVRRREEQPPKPLNTHHRQQQQQHQTYLLVKIAP